MFATYYVLHVESTTKHSGIWRSRQRTSGLMKCIERSSTHNRHKYKHIQSSSRVGIKKRKLRVAVAASWLYSVICIKAVPVNTLYRPEQEVYLYMCCWWCVLCYTTESVRFAAAPFHGLLLHYTAGRSAGRSHLSRPVLLCRRQCSTAGWRDAC